MDTPGSRLKQERLRLGRSQEEFAHLGGVQKRSQINYEKGERKPDAAYFAKIAAAGANVDYILTGTPVKLRDALSQVRTASEIAARYGKTDAEKAALQADIFNALRAAQPPAEDLALLEHYQNAADVVKPAILAAAASLAAAAPYADGALDATAKTRSRKTTR